MLPGGKLDVIDIEFHRAKNFHGGIDGFGSGVIARENHDFFSRHFELLIANLKTEERDPKPRGEKSDPKPLTGFGLPGAPERCALRAVSTEGQGNGNENSPALKMLTARSAHLHPACGKRETRQGFRMPDYINSDFAAVEHSRTREPSISMLGEIVRSSYAMISIGRRFTHASHQVKETSNQNPE
jgi:hypothetical protein